MIKLFLSLIYFSLLIPFVAPASLDTSPVVKIANQIAVLEFQQHQINRMWGIGIKLIQQLNAGKNDNLDDAFLNPNHYWQQPKEQKSNLKKRFPALEYLETLIQKSNLNNINKDIFKQQNLIKNFDKTLDKNFLIKVLSEYHRQALDLKFNAIDHLLDINYTNTEATLAKDKYNTTDAWLGYAKEQTQTDYKIIRQFFTDLQLKDGDIFYDLGSGYGRVVFYGALMYPKVQFKGIELVTERAALTQKTVDKLQLNNAKFIAGDVLTQDLSDGKIFYMFNPFPSIMDKFLPKLQAVAKKHKIVVVAYGNTALELRYLDWLKLQKSYELPFSLSPLAIYTSTADSSI